MAGLACSGSEPVDTGTNEGAARIETESGLAINFVSVRDSKRATHADPGAGLETCDTDIEYVQLTGTRFDEKINAILKSEAGVPTEPCDDPRMIDSRATIRFMGKGFMSVMESGGSYYAGAAHPNSEFIYKNVDVTTGERVTLDKLLLPAAKDTILRSIRAQIAIQKDGSGRTAVPLDDSLKSALRDALGYTVPQDRALSDLQSFSLSSAGVRIDLSNALPHALQALDAEYLVRWRTLADVMQPAAKQRFGVR